MRKFIATLLLVPTLLFAEPKFVQGNMQIICGKTEELLTTVSQEFKETMLWTAKEKNRVIVSLWQNTDSNTFTIVKTDPYSKISCVIAIGKLHAPA